MHAAGNTIHAAPPWYIWLAVVVVGGIDPMHQVARPGLRTDDTPPAPAPGEVTGAERGERVPEAHEEVSDLGRRNGPLVGHGQHQ